MADGDAMVMSTRGPGTASSFQVHVGKADAPTGGYSSLLLNGRMEKWTDTSAIVDEFTFTDQNTGTPTLARQSGRRTGGTGDYFQRVTWASVASGDLCKLTQDVMFKGDPSLDAYGHDNQTFTATCWLKCGIAATYDALIGLQEIDEAGALTGGATTTSRTNIDTSWEQRTVTHTVSDNNAAGLRFIVDVDVVATTDTTLDFDEASVYSSYTFADNPVHPDSSQLMTPGRLLARTSDGSLLRARSAEQGISKIERRLRFNLIDVDQLKALRSLWLLDSPVLWTTNSPILPAQLFVRFGPSFPFSLIRGGVYGRSHYAGTLRVRQV